MGNFKPYPLKEVYRLIEPGPVVLVTTALKDEKNIMTMSWHTMIDFEPPIIACVVSNRNHSFNILRKSKECVINIPTSKIAQEVVGCGNTSGTNKNKFEYFHLTPTAASTVKAPLIKECYACLECKVIDSSLATKYNLFFLEVKKAWIRKEKTKYPATLHHFGRGHFMLPGKIIKIASRMK
ncbi:flavin reductase family protein [Bdellovibrio sp.]|uniref:flavin reductase family protein n=1 Tax=Bdellovibrio sp. TaxID=28201 RepID=UPI0039E3BE63